MTLDERLVQVTSALTKVGLRYLVMGGHAVRHYEISRDTFDFDFHLSLTGADDLITRLRESGLFGETAPRELPGWRGSDFRRQRPVNFLGGAAAADDKVLRNSEFAICDWETV